MDVPQDNAVPAQPDAGSPGLYQRALEEEAKQDAERNGTNSQYINLDFVLGSAAEVERLWSLAKYILVNQRKTMNSQMFECLLFLKYNRKYWNKEMVIEAYRRAQRNQASVKYDRLAMHARREQEAADAAMAEFGTAEEN